MITGVHIFILCLIGSALVHYDPTLYFYVIQATAVAHGMYIYQRSEMASSKISGLAIAFMALVNGLCLLFGVGKEYIEVFGVVAIVLSVFIILISLVQEVIQNNGRK